MPAGGGREEGHIVLHITVLLRTLLAIMGNWNRSLGRLLIYSATVRAAAAAVEGGRSKTLIHAGKM